MRGRHTAKGRQAEPFQGFEPLDASFVFCPNQFLDYCIPTQRRGVVRITGYVLYQTLRWMDDAGRPIDTDIPARYHDLVKHAGVSRGEVRRSLDASLAANFITCIKKPQPKSAGQAGRVGEYGVVWHDRFTGQTEVFRGFYAGEGRRTPIPHAFFTEILPNESLAVVRVVAAVIRHTVGYSSQFGGRRTQVALSFSILQKYTGLSRKTLGPAISTAIDKGYLVVVEKGVFSPDQQEQRATTYALKWQQQAADRDIGLKRLPESTTRSVQKGCQKDQFKKVVSVGSKSTPDDRFKNVTSSKEAREKINKQQHAAAGFDAFAALLDIGFDETTATHLATQHSPENIRKQIKWLRARHADKNALGLLRKAIEEDWSPPKATIRQTERGTRKAARSMKQVVVDSGHRQRRQKHRQELLSTWEGLRKHQQQRHHQTAIHEARSTVERRHLQRHTDLANPPTATLIAMARSLRLPVGESS